MHNCRETKEQITEFLLDGADRAPDEVLRAELRRGCTECRSEFDALKATLRLTTRLRDTFAPTEDYWTSYHAKLREKLVNVNTVSDSHRPSLFRRFLSYSLPVPAPVALAVLIVCVILVPVAIRATRQPTAQISSVVRVPIEVPVIQEKIVTRVVYRERRPRSKRMTDVARVNGTFAKSQKPPNAEIPPSLAGFKPTEEVKLTVIKGGSANEK